MLQEAGKSHLMFERKPNWIKCRKQALKLNKNMTVFEYSYWNCESNVAPKPQNEAWGVIAFYSFGSGVGTGHGPPEEAFP